MYGGVVRYVCVSVYEEGSHNWRIILLHITEPHVETFACVYRKLAAKRDGRKTRPTVNTAIQSNHDMTTTTASERLRCADGNEVKNACSSKRRLVSSWICDRRSHSNINKPQRHGNQEKFMFIRSHFSHYKFLAIINLAKAKNQSLWANSKCFSLFSTSGRVRTHFCDYALLLKMCIENIFSAACIALGWCLFAQSLS